MFDISNLSGGIAAFVTYFGLALVLLAAFVWVFVRFTPYDDFALIAQNNEAAALSLGGACLGFTLPLVSSIFYTKSPAEMCVWAAITGAVQLLVFTLMRARVPSIREGHRAPALLLACLAVCVGLLQAVCISH